jgi:acetyl-CoA carboxylase carboxyltransferase component
VLDVDASQKGARFVRTCNLYGLPLVVLVDTPGFMPGRRQESAGVIRHGAELLRAFIEARVPRVTVIVRKAYGGAYITMNSKDLGADAVLAWHGAETGIMDAHRAVELIHRRRLASAADRTSERDRLASAYAREHLHVEDCVAGASIDAVIAPRETRERVAEAVERASVGERSPLRNGGEARIPVRT